MRNGQKVKEALRNVLHGTLRDVDEKEKGKRKGKEKENGKEKGAIVTLPPPQDWSSRSIVGWSGSVSKNKGRRCLRGMSRRRGAPGWFW